MKKILLIIGVLVIGFVIYEMNKKPYSIDYVIDKYDTTDFSYFKNTHIFIRGQDRSFRVYIVVKDTSTCGICWIHTNGAGNVIDSVTYRDSVLCNYYYTDAEIKTMVDKYNAFGIGSLSVDSVGNVYLNPYTSDGQQFLFKQNSKVNKLIPLNFRHVKGDWYINDFYNPLD
jgi:hypothetical protein